MINAQLFPVLVFPVLGVIATASVTSVAISLLPVAKHSERWNVCYEDAID